MMHDVIKERVAPDNLTEYFNFYAIIERRKCQQLESTGRAENIQSVEDNFLNMMHDVIKGRVSPDNLTEYFNSYAKIEGRECQQLESTGRAENIQSVEEDIESDPLDLDGKEIENI
ncbi:unnamed protein product [Lasius platythorax]|uniref:Uncharacterized protein n=1 Tax=Lasius platythorax TaxID=488582 RepID=A0AAV2NRN4_9HYME